MKIKNLICIPIIVAAAAVPTIMYANNNYFGNLKDNINNENLFVSDSSNTFLFSASQENAENDGLNQAEIYNTNYNNSIYRDFYNKYVKSGLVFGKDLVPVNELKDKEELTMVSSYDLPWDNELGFDYNIPLFYTNDGYGVLIIKQNDNNIPSNISLNYNDKIDGMIKNILYGYINIPESYKSSLSDNEILWAGNIAIKIAHEEISIDQLKSAEVIEEQEEKANNIISFIEYLLDSKYENKYVNITIPESFNPVYNQNGELDGIHSDVGYIDTNYNNYKIAIYNKNNTPANSLSIFNADDPDCYYSNGYNINSFVISYKTSDLDYYKTTCINKQQDINPYGDDLYQFTNPNNYDEQLIFSGENISDQYYIDESGSCFYVAKPISDISFYDIDLTPENYCELFKTATINVNLTEQFSGNKIESGFVELIKKDENYNDSGDANVSSIFSATIEDGTAKLVGIPDGEYVLKLRVDNNKYLHPEDLDLSIELDYSNTAPIQEISIDTSVTALYTNLYVTDEQNSPMSNLNFDLYNISDGQEQYMGEFVTNNDGTLLIYNLTEGHYRVLIKSDDDNIDGATLYFYVDRHSEISEIENCHLTLNTNGSIYEYVEYND